MHLIANFRFLSVCVQRSRSLEYRSNEPSLLASLSIHQSVIIGMYNTLDFIRQICYGCYESHSQNIYTENIALNKKIYTLASVRMIAFV